MDGAGNQRRVRAALQREIPVSGTVGRPRGLTQSRGLTQQGVSEFMLALARHHGRSADDFTIRDAAERKTERPPASIYAGRLQLMD